MPKRILGLAALGLLLIAGTSSKVQAQNLKIGFTDHEVIIAAMPDYRSVQQELQQEYQNSQATLQARAEEFQGKVEQYQKQQALLSEESRTTREQELMQEQQQIQQLASQSEQQLAEREAELLEPIFQRVDEAIKSVAQEMSLDIVLRSQAGPLQPIILYVNEDKILNITPDVARKLGLDVDDQAASN